MSNGPILVISGTNRAQSNALRVARVLEAEYQNAKTPVEVFPLTELPPEVFDASAYTKKPEPMVAIQQRVLAASGLHIVTPEYNGSFPGVLKYFIDMLKFPESFEHKPVAFVGEANGTWGAVRSVEQLIQIFHYRNAHVFPDRVFIPDIRSRFNEKGELADAAIAQRLHKQAVGFSQFVARFQAASPA